MIKNSYIKKIDENHWRVFSEKGKNLGTFKSLDAAKKRLKQVEYFKNKKAELETTNTFSGICRELNKKDHSKLLEFMKNFKSIFEKSLDENLTIEELEPAILAQLKYDTQND